MSTVGEVQQGTELNGIYRIDEKIAIGGMGEVYRGHNIQTNDPVAIKIVLPEFARDETILALFRKEASVLNHLSHEAIVRYHVFSIDAGIARPYLAMEFVDGESLGDRAGRTPFTADETIVLTRHLASGLQTAHNAGVIHRDLSPDNIIINKGEVGRAKIIDFGIAKSAKVGGGTLLGGKFAGKYNFVSPEQLGLFGGEVTPKSDIYSLGLVVAAALKGAPLDMSGTQVDVIEKRRHVPDLTGVDSVLLPLITAMLQPDPENRPESMSEIADWLIALKASDNKQAPSAPVFGKVSVAPSPSAAAAAEQPETPAAASEAPDPDASKPAPGGATPSDADGPESSGPNPSGPNPSGQVASTPSSPVSQGPVSGEPASSGELPAGPVSAPATSAPSGPSAAEPVPGTPAFASLSLDTPDPQSVSSEARSDAMLTDSGTVLTQHPAPETGAPGERPAAAVPDPEPPVAQAAPAAAPPPRRRQADSNRPLPTTMVKPEKKSSFGLIAAIAIVLVALGGGAAYYYITVDGDTKKAGATDPGPTLVPSTGDKEPKETKTAKGTEGTGTEPGSGDKDPLDPKTDPGDKPITIETPDPPDVVVSQAATMMETVNSFNGGKCFYAAAKDIGDKSLKIEGFGLGAQPFEKLEQLVLSTHGVEPDIGIRKIVDGQCAVVEFLADIRPFETVKPVLTLSNDWIKSGDSLRGNVSNVGDKIISTLLIDNQGVAYNLGPHLKRVGDRADFNIKLVDLAPREAQPQLILTIVSERQIDELQLGSAVLAKTYFPDVLKKMKAVGGEFGTAVKFFKLGG